MEKNNYGFNFDPNKVDENIEKKAVDKNGGFTVRASSDGNPLGGNFESTNYFIANHKAKTKVRKIESSNIGKGSHGFAGVATLATIIAVAGFVIAYLVLKY